MNGKTSKRLRKYTDMQIKLAGGIDKLYYSYFTKPALLKRPLRILIRLLSKKYRETEQSYRYKTLMNLFKKSMKRSFD